jgi:hypothetical protein
LTRQGVINTDAAVTRWSQGGRKAVISTRKALINKALINKALINKALINKALINKALINKALINKAVINKAVIKAVTALVAVINTCTQH